MTPQGQITIPAAIRRCLGPQAGQVLEFDEEAPYILAVPVFDEEAMRAVVGCARGRIKENSDEWLDETRGPVDEGDR
jgi:bifunctional DNA-binding transcriptional regulator/antitoxin component of YhaV-PrlF toxin-antitoxin module